MSRIGWVLVALGAVIGAFAIGRWSGRGAAAPSSASTAPKTSSVPARATAPGEPTTPAPSPGSGAAAPDQAPPTEANAGSGAGTAARPTTLAACVTDLETMRAAEADRVAVQGTPIPPPGNDTPARFQQAALSGNLTRAMAQAKVRGGLDGTDCSEYPCIVYGRINGTEESMEPIEQARAFDVYDDDISNIILWAQTDEAKEEAAGRRGPRDERAEQVLFAIAFYAREDAAARGDELDRRIRARVTDLWNAANPSDESGASR